MKPANQPRRAVDPDDGPRPRLGPMRALALLVPLTWVAWRRGLLRHEVERQSGSRQHHEPGPTALPADAVDPRPEAEHRPTVSAVIPALNEAGSIGWVLENLPASVTEVVLVDGLSTDRTEAVARLLVPNLVVVHQRDRGKGAALRAGFYAARGDIIVMLDADGSTDPREIDRFIDALVAGADFTKGSREMLGGGSVDFTVVRRLGNLAFVRLANLMYGTRFTDLLYGYCAFWRDGLDDLGLSADGFEIETQLVVNAVKAGMTITEVPSTELERRAGASNLSALRDGLRILRTVFVEHPALGDPAPGEIFEMVEIERAAPDEPGWLPAGSDRRDGGSRRRVESAAHPLSFVGAERRLSLERRSTPARTVQVLVPRRSPEPPGTGPRGSAEWRAARERRAAAMRDEASRLADSLGSDRPERARRVGD